MKMVDRHDEIGRISNENVFLFLLSTRADGLGIRAKFSITKICIRRGANTRMRKRAFSNVVIVNFKEFDYRAEHVSGAGRKLSARERSGERA